MSAVSDNTQQADGVVSPGSPSEAVTGLRQNQVPISRSAITGYERPERARTSHACEPCRERKTKCDGERPSCRRCLHTGTGCHYGYGKGWKKRKTAEDLTVTSRKLARYETLLNDIMPLVPSDIRLMIEEARQQEIFPINTAESRDSSTPSSNPTPDGEHKSVSPSSNRLPLPMPLQPSQSSNNTVPPPRSMPRASTAASPPPHSSSVVPPLMKPSAEELSNNGALRLPSIARNGMLLEHNGQPSTSSVHVPHSPTTARILAQAASAATYQNHTPDGIM